MTGANLICWDDYQPGDMPPEMAARIRDWYDGLKREGRITERVASTPDGSVTFVFVQGNESPGPGGPGEGQGEEARAQMPPPGPDQGAP